ESEELRAAREHAPAEAPIADASTDQVPARDGEVGAPIHLLPQIDDDLGRMLQIGVDDGEHLAARRLPTANDGRREAPLAAPTHDPELRILGREAGRDLPRLVGSVV